MKRGSRAVIGAFLLVTAVGAGDGKEADDTRINDPLAFWNAKVAALAYSEAGQHEKAASILERLATVSPENGELWNHLAEANLARGEFEKAIEALHHVRDLGFKTPSESAYRLAKAHAVSGEVDEALRWLSTSLAEGYRFRDRVFAEPAFEALREDPRFTNLFRPLPADIDRVEGWRTDVEFLVGEIRRVHYTYRHQALPDTFTGQAARLRAQIPNWSDQRIVVEIQRLLATVGDGHTLAFPFGMTRGALQRLPIGLWLFSDGLYVIKSGDELVGSGSRILAIGDVEVEELLDRLKPWVSHDNPSGFRWVAPIYLTFVDYLLAVGVSTEESVRVTLEEPTGYVSTVSISPEEADPQEIPLRLIPPPSVEAPLYLQELHKPFWSRHLLEGSVLYVQMNQVADDDPQTLAEFGRDLRRQTDKGDFAALILDLRHNNGGDAGRLREIVRALVHFETTSPRGRIFVITSRNTFSAAQTLSNLAEQFTDAIFIGEPAGTRPNRLGNEAPFRLPFSGIMGTISSGYNQGATSRDHRLWIAPDLAVSLSSRDYFEGRDPALDAVLLMISTLGSARK